MTFWRSSRTAVPRFDAGNYGDDACTGSKNFRECGDQFLRYFLRGLAGASM